MFFNAASAEEASYDPRKESPCLKDLLSPIVILPDTPDVSSHLVCMVTIISGRNQILYMINNYKHNI